MRQSRIQPTLRGANIGRLNAQQRTFVLALLADKSFNATAAAKVAAYKHPTVAASKLMKNKIVAAALGKAMRLREERTLVNADKVVVELARLAFFNTRDVFDEDGSLKPMSELSPEIACAISEVETRTTVGQEQARRLRLRSTKCTVNLLRWNCWLATWEFSRIRKSRLRVM